MRTAATLSPTIPPSKCRFTVPDESAVPALSLSGSSSAETLTYVDWTSNCIWVVMMQRPPSELHWKVEVLGAEPLTKVEAVGAPLPSAETADRFGSSGEAQPSWPLGNELHGPRPFTDWQFPDVSGRRCASGPLLPYPWL